MMKIKKKRQKNKINEHFIAEESKDISHDDLEKLERKQNRLKKILNLKVFANQKEKIKLLLEIVQQYRKGAYHQIPWRSIAAMTFTLVYIINPLDMVPDVLPFVGYVDDVSVFMALLKLVERDIQDYEDWKTVDGEISEY